MLCFFEKDLDINDLLEFNKNEFFKNILEGNWTKNLESSLFTEYLINENKQFDKDIKLSFAVSCLLLFIKENFTGPSESNIPKLYLDRLQTIDRWNLESLHIDGVEINTNIKHLELLMIASNFIDDLIKLNPSDVIISVWYIRILKTHQSILDENSITLYDEFQKIHQMLKSGNKLSEIENTRHRFLIDLEIISIYLMYRRVYEVEKLINQVKIDYQIEIIEEGVLGMRTKWQQKALPQFYVSIKQEFSEMNLSSNITHKNTKLLKLLELEDDTRLEEIKFLNEKHNELQHISSMLQNFVLIMIKYMQVSQPKDKLSDEEIQPYLNLLLKQDCGPWAIRLNALLIKIKLESNHRRTVDRSLRQCEDIVKYTKSSNSTSQEERLSYVFSSLMTPHFKIKVLLADLMVSLGLIKGALDIYLETHQWENVINCYTRLQLKHKAAEVIQQQLAKHPTAKLYCLLGDSTDDISWYEKAWEFSKHKSGVAQKHWAMHYFGKNEYSKAIPHFRKSLEINSLQENLWLRLGYAALSIENYELASSAYIRYTQLEPNGFESWNNLAKCFIKLGNKKRAHKVLQEALKCNYDNWKIWENFLLVSIDVGSFEDALNAYSRLIDIKDKYFDEEVLAILINAIFKNLMDVDGNSTYRLRKKAVELLARLGSIHTNEGVIWELSVLLTDDPLKKAEKMLKAYRGYTSKSLDWSKDETLGLKLIKLSHDLCKFSLEASHNSENNTNVLISQLSSARLTAQGCVKVAVNNDWKSCKEILENINEILNQILEKIKELKQK